MVYAPTGWTLYREANTPDLNVALEPNAVTIFTYAFLTIGDLNMLFVGKLQPVTVY